jgi:hypothetical protein
MRRKEGLRRFIVPSERGKGSAEVQARTGVRWLQRAHCGEVQRGVVVPLQRDENGASIELSGLCSHAKAWSKRTRGVARR